MTEAEMIAKFEEAGCKDVWIIHRPGGGYKDGKLYGVSLITPNGERFMFATTVPRLVGDDTDRIFRLNHWRQWLDSALELTPA